MNRLIAIALALMALTSFGSQQTQVAESRARHIREVQRARAERIKREGERNARIIVEESKKCCPVVIMPNGIIGVTIHHTQCGIGLGEFGIGESSSYTENKIRDIKQNSRLRSNDSRWGNRNLNKRKFKSSGPARRRK